MQATSDHFLLYTEATRSEDSTPRWKFVLQSVGGDEQLSADDSELNSRTSRLELLAVVRGLEAIDRPARVTLLTGSRYVSRGIRRQLSQWREDNWQWERFGELVPIRDHDLWQRVDRALQYSPGRMLRLAGGRPAPARTHGRAPARCLPRLWLRCDAAF